MTDLQHKSAQRERASQPQAPASGQAPEEGVRLFDEAPPTSAAAAGDPGDVTARHAAVLGDPRTLQRSVGQRAALVRSLQRGYGNGHVARVLARVHAAPDLQREEAPSDTPTPAQKEAALKAAVAAQAQAVAAKTKGVSQAGAAQAAAGTEKAVGAANKQKATAASGAAQATAAAGAQERKARGEGAPAAAKGAPAAPAAARVSPPQGRAPASPDEDPAFQAALGKLRAGGAKARAHGPAAKKASAAQAAAESPAAELAGQAQSSQVGKMAQAEAPPFDAAGFKAKLMERIAALAPKSAKEADEFKESGKIEGVKGQMQGEVKAEGDKSRGPVEQAAAAAPDPSAATPHQATPLAEEQPGAPEAAPDPSAAAPKPKTSAEVEAPIKEAPKEIDQQMAEADVSDETLRSSNEPEFQAAAEAKDTAKEHAERGPQEFRQAEQGQIEAGQAEAGSSAEAGMGEMHGARAQALQQVGGQQGQTKSKDEEARAKVGADIQAIYAETKGKVEAILCGIDAKVTQAFDQGAAAAKQTFEDYVDRRMSAYKEERYGGWFGWARWAKDKIAGMPGEVNAFYSEGRALYMKEMDAVVDRVVAIIGAAISAAKAEIGEGKRKISEYVAKLPADQRKLGQQAASDIQSQFDQLEQDVQAKQDGLIDTLASKYNENVKAIDARIEELKAANRGLVDKALDLVGGVIKTIIQLKDTLLGFLKRVAEVVGYIIKHPIDFLGNLIDGVSLGIKNFVANIGSHLKKGLMTWLFGELAAGGIELPTSFDMKGILTLVMQILGLTWANLRARVVKALGEPVVKVLEGSFKIFQIVREQGIGGLWEFIKEQVGNLKDMVLDGIKDLLVSEVIKAGMQWLMSLLGGPLGAFIKAVKAIIDIVIWFVNNASRIMALVNAVIDSMAAIASGNIAAAAKFIEDSLSKAIPLVIGFLASLLGLGNLAGKIRGVIEKVQAPVNKAIDWVVGKAKGFAKKIGGKIGGKLKKEETPAEKEKRLEKGLSAGVAAVNKYAGKRVGALVLKPLLGVIKLRHKLSVLEPFEKGKVWAVRADIQRMKEKESGASVVSADGTLPKILVNPELAPDTNTPPSAASASAAPGSVSPPTTGNQSTQSPQAASQDPAGDRVRFGPRIRRDLIIFWHEQIKSNPDKADTYRRYIDNIVNQVRPTPTQSEMEMAYIRGTYGERGESRREVPYMHGREVSGRPKGHTRPDIKDPGSALVEVKRYKIENVAGLIAKLIKQISDRAEHLPYDIHKNQAITIDFRGQRLSRAQIAEVRTRVVSEINAALAGRNIQLQLTLDRVEVVTW